MTRLCYAESDETVWGQLYGAARRRYSTLSRAWELHSGVPGDGSSYGSLVTQQISRAELERARLDVRGEALRKTAARLQELASGAALALTAADSSLMQIDRDYTKLHAEVRRREACGCAPWCRQTSACDS